MTRKLSDGSYISSLSNCVVGCCSNIWTDKEKCGLHYLL